jgi:hypothetical protein
MLQKYEGEGGSNMNCEVGKAYWTIHPSSESGDYGAEIGDVNTPYMSICRSMKVIPPYHVHNNDRIECYFSANNDQGESDNDPNASFYIYYQTDLDASVFSNEIDAFNALYELKKRNILKEIQALANLAVSMERCKKGT